MRKLLLGSVLFSAWANLHTLYAQQAFDWANAMTGTGDAEVGHVLTDASNNSIVLGKFQGSCNVGGTDLTNGGSWDVFLAKYDANGVHQWSISIGATGADEAADVAINPLNGNIVITGIFWGIVDFDPGAGNAMIASNGLSDIFCAEYDASNGQFVQAFGIGGPQSDAGENVVVDDNGDIILAGKFNDANVDFDPSAGTSTLSSVGALDIFLAKYSSGVNPSLYWVDQIASTTSDDVNAIALDAAGDILITGPLAGTTDFDPNAPTSNLTPVGTWDCYIAKYSGSTGNLGWAENVVSGGTSAPSAITLDGTDNIYLSGYFMGSVDMDPGAGTQSMTATASSDAFLAKYSPTAGYLWSFGLGAASFNYAYDVAFDASGNVMLAGSFNTSMDVDPGAGTYTLTSNGAADGFVARYTSGGAFVDAFSVGGAGGDEVLTVGLDASGSEYSAGRFSATVDFDPSISEANLNSTGATDGFIVRYSDLALELENTVLDQARVYPNPIVEQMIVLLPQGGAHSLIEVFTTDGSLVHSVSVENETEVKVDTAHWHSGAYMVRVSQAGGQRIFTVVK